MTATRIGIFFYVSSCGFAQFAQLGGPSTLSSGNPPTNTQPQVQTGFTPFISFNQIYDSGLPGAVADPNSTLGNTGAFGVEAEVGIAGYHRWQRTALEIHYQGDLREYTRKTMYDGTNQFLDLSISWWLARYLNLNLKESGGSFTRGFGLPFGSEFFTSPVSESLSSPALLDNRVNYVSSEGELTYERSVRLAFSVAAEGFLLRQQSNELFGIGGYLARAAATYRLSRHATIGGEYDFTHFGITTHLGAADLQMVGVNYAALLSRTWEVALRAGAVRAEMRSSVPISSDPAVAGITGRQTGFETAYQLNNSSSIAARIAKNTRYALLQVEYERGLSPGNGLWVASTIGGVHASYTYTGIRRWSVETACGYSSMTNVFRSVQQYHGYNGDVSVSRLLEKHVRMIARIDLRQYDVTTFLLPNRMFYRITLGVSFHPGSSAIPSAHF